MFGLLSEYTHSSCHLHKSAVFDLSVNFDNILFLMLISRMHQVITQTSVIRKDYESSCVLIKPSYRKNPFPYVDYVDDGTFSVLLACSDYSIRFIEFIINELVSLFDFFVVYFHFVHFWIYALSYGGRFSIHKNRSGADKLLSFPS